MCARLTRPRHLLLPRARSRLLDIVAFSLSFFLRLCFLQRYRMLGPRGPCVSLSRPSSILPLAWGVHICPMRPGLMNRGVDVSRVLSGRGSAQPVTSCNCRYTRKDLGRSQTNSTGCHVRCTMRRFRGIPGPAVLLVSSILAGRQSVIDISSQTDIVSLSDIILLALCMCFYQNYS
ncbi:hypothetical protein V8C26DRAFT_6478 [Trichoderma gracile]